MAAISIPQPRKAERQRVKLKIGIQGPSGSGKTWGALALAKNLWPDAKICVVDTENESASLYADKFEFDTIPLSPPFTSERYEACIEAVVRAGYDVLIMDSISQQWDGDGGILRRKEELDQRPGANSYTNWSKFTPEHTQFIEAIKQAPIHILATMRSKQDYVLSENDRGKKTPVKVGMAPVQRDGFDYEFSLVFDVQMDHRAVVSKDRTQLFGGKVVDLSSPKIADELRVWLESGKMAPESDRGSWKVGEHPKEIAVENAVTITVTIEEQKSDDKHFFWLCKNGKPCIIFALQSNNDSQYKRLIDQQGKSITVKVYDRGVKADRQCYELADVVSVVAPQVVKGTIVGDVYVGEVVSVTRKHGKPGKSDYISVWTTMPTSEVNISETLTCFHLGLESALKDCEGRKCKLKVKKSGAYWNVDDVLEVEGVPYKDGKIAE